MGLNLPKTPTFRGPPVLWKRILAFAIDILALDLIIGFPIREVVVNLVPEGGISETVAYVNLHPNTGALVSLAMTLYGLLMMLYFVVLEYKMGQTLGKMLMGIKVESIKKDLGFLECIIRSMYLIFVFPFILLWIIDPIFMIFSNQKRRLSEILSKTRTIQVYSLH